MFSLYFSKIQNQSFLNLKKYFKVIVIHCLTENKQKSYLKCNKNFYYLFIDWNIILNCVRPEWCCRQEI